MSRVNCKNKEEVDSCDSKTDDCSKYYDTNKNVCEEGNDKCKSGTDKCRKEKKGNTSVTSLEESEVMRIIITYLVVFFMILALVATSDSKDSLMIMMLFTGLYLVACGLFDYFWMKYYLIKNRTTGDTSGRDTFHNILHMVLPGIVIIFGYSFLLSGFNTILDVSNMKSFMLFMIKLISLIIIIVGYLYYTIKLKEIVSESSNNKDKNTQIDILYSILHPVAILLISGLFYMLILFTINRKKMVVSSASAPAPAPAPDPAPVEAVVNPVR